MGAEDPGRLISPKDTVMYRDIGVSTVQTTAKTAHCVGQLVMTDGSVGDGQVDGQVVIIA